MVIVAICLASTSASFTPACQPEFFSNFVEGYFEGNHIQFFN